MVGEPVTATLSPHNFNPDHNLVYSWTSTGGRATGSGASTTVDTNGLPGGKYALTGDAHDARMKKEGGKRPGGTKHKSEKP